MTTINTANVLRAAVLSSYDGLVSNLSVTIVVGAAQGDVILATLAAIFGGAISMSTGEFLSVWVQNEALEDDELSPTMAAGVAIAAFTICGLLPLGGFLLSGLIGAFIAGMLCLGIVGTIASRYTCMTPWRLGLRLVAFGTLAGSVGLVAGVLL